MINILYLVNKSHMKSYEEVRYSPYVALLTWSNLQCVYTTLMNVRDLPCNPSLDKNPRSAISTGWSHAHYQAVLHFVPTHWPYQTKLKTCTLTREHVMRRQSSHIKVRVKICRHVLCIYSVRYYHAFVVNVLLNQFVLWMRCRVDMFRCTCYETVECFGRFPLRCREIHPTPAYLFHITLCVCSSIRS